VKSVEISPGINEFAPKLDELAARTLSFGARLRKRGGFLMNAAPEHEMRGVQPLSFGAVLLQREAHRSDSGAESYAHGTGSLAPYGFPGGRSPSLATGRQRVRGTPTETFSGFTLWASITGSSWVRVRSASRLMPAIG